MKYSRKAVNIIWKHKHINTPTKAAKRRAQRIRNKKSEG